MPNRRTDNNRTDAQIPFQVVDGRPVSPGPSTGIRYGRNRLGHWGEQACADALVTATDTGGHRWIAMVERGDGHGWALPGGYVDPGEHPVDAAIRELSEEARVNLPAHWLHRDRWQADAPRFMPDPRGSDESWMVSVVARCDLGRWITAPGLTCGDDAKRAEWVRADDFDTLVRYLADTFNDRVFSAHVDLLRELLG